MTRAIAVFCMPDRSHFQRLRAVIADLATHGFEPHVFTHARFRDDVVRLGGRFVDLFSRRPIEGIDDESWPHPIRFTSFAGRYAGDIARDVAAIGAAAVVYDTHAVVGVAVARQLGIPYINVCAGHAVVPDRFVTILREHPRVRVSPKCQAAVEQLRLRDGIEEASPFWFATALSPHLNLYCEPPEFLAPADRSIFAPLAFFGSLPSDADWRDTRRADRPFAGESPALRVYASFGHVVWETRSQEAFGALDAIAEALAHRRGSRMLVSLGGGQPPADVLARLSRPHVSVEPYVDQHRALRDADLFLTHHGLNSTHEGIFVGVPMISYPFLWDQPAMAVMCQRLGLAVALSDRVMGPVSVGQAEAALDAAVTTRAAMHAALDTARGWERDVVAARPAVLERVRALVS